jgi:INO80 complex subunit B
VTENLLFYESSREQKRTIDRLLLKRETKNKSNAANPSASSSSGTATSGPSSAPRVPCYSWKQTADGECLLTIPPVMEASILTPRTLPEPPKVINCSIQGCSNPKRYSCSKTHVPLCSLNCYRTNMRSLGLAA